LGIGDWAQSAIPNPQSPIPKLFYFIIKKKFKLIIKIIILNIIKLFNYSPKKKI